MNPERKQRWTTALRSGEYKQGKSGLLMVNGETGERSHCCLGVLLEIEGVESRLHHFRANGDITYGFKSSFGEFVLTGMPEVGTFELSDDEAYYVAQMNDRGRTFSEIADYIDETF